MWDTQNATNKRWMPLHFDLKVAVRELMGRVRNVLLIKCILDLGNPRGVGILGERAHGPREE